MRILHIAHRFFPPCRGGLSVYVSKISELHSREHQVEVWTTLEGKYPGLELVNRCLIRRFPARLWLSENPISVSMFQHFLRTNNEGFDIVVAHSHLMFTTVIAYWLSQLSSIPLVVVSHGLRVKRGPVFDLLEEAYISSVSRKILRNADRVIALSGMEVKGLIRLGVPMSRISRVPQGVDCKMFRPSPAAREKSLLVWAGRFVHEKNLEFLLEVFADLRRKIDVQLVLAGDGPERSRMQRLSRQLGLGQSVTFPGLLTHAQVSSLLKRATAFCLPSITEAAPLALLEAMASGLPVLASRGLGLEEYAEGAALFLEPSSHDDWLLGCEHILRNSREQFKLGAEARKLAMQNDWNIVAQLVMNVLDTTTKLSDH